MRFVFTLRSRACHDKQLHILHTKTMAFRVLLLFFSVRYYSIFSHLSVLKRARVVNAHLILATKPVDFFLPLCTADASPLSTRKMPLKCASYAVRPPCRFPVRSYLAPRSAPSSGIHCAWPASRACYHLRRSPLQGSGV